MSRTQAAITLSLLMALTSLTRTALAQVAPSEPASAAAKAQARQHFQRGAELFQEGLYRPALVELKRAYEIAPNYRLHYNIGQTHVALGEFVEAVQAYESFLAQGGTAVEPARRAELEAELPQLRQHTAALTIRVSRQGARVFVDEREVGKAPLAQRVLVNVGHHRVSARTEDGASATAEVEVAGGDVEEVALALDARARESPAPRALSPAPVVAKPRLSTRKKWAIGMFTSAAALGIAGGTLAWIANSARDDHDQALRTRPGDPQALEDARDRLWRTSLSADVLLGGALLSGVAGVVTSLTKGRAAGAGREKRRAQLKLGLGPRALTLHGRF